MVGDTSLAEVELSVEVLGYAGIHLGVHVGGEEGCGHVALLDVPVELGGESE